MNPNRTAQSGVIEFRPRARLLKLIGSELISDDVLAITELVKNAHDADASQVTVSFRGVTSTSGQIKILDDGFGMNLETLLRHWMEPAGTSKYGPGRLTPAGRRVLGEKGVGRFATDKLGSSLELVSRKPGDTSEIRAIFDWDAFDNHESLLSDIKSHWEVRYPEILTDHGTVLGISGLRSIWTERMFRRLSTRLARLRSPFEQLHDFTIMIESDEFPHYSGELRADFLDRAPYRIQASFDGRHSIELQQDRARTSTHSWNGSGDLTCGPLKIHIFAFDLETDATARIGPRMEVRAWLREWSGISVYRDGFRVWPYGEPHDDWLRLDQRRVNNPVVRLSNNQVVGFVEISQDRNPLLVDQTNREGLIHNVAYDDLRRLLYFVLQILEAERQTIRHPSVRGSSSVERTEKRPDEIASQLERVSRRVTPEIATELSRIADRSREMLARQEVDHRRVIEGYADLAALGHAASGLSCSVEPHLAQLQESAARIRNALRVDDRKLASSALKELEASLLAIRNRVAMVTPMESTASQRRRALDVPSELQAFRDLTRAVLVETGTDIELTAPADEVLRVEMRPEAFHRLLHILVMNSLDWLHGHREPRIRISARPTDARCEIIVSDNGPGIPQAIADRVFEPLFSTKESGRGMGLTIARSIVELHGGQISVVVDGRRRGAHLRVLLPRKRSRATVHS